MLYAIVVVAVLILDQGLKYWTRVNIAFETGEKTLIPNILSMTNIHNEGAAFGLLEGWRWILVGIVVIFSILVIILVSKKIIQGSFGRWMAILILAGALGNGIDRLLFGYVVDMFRFVFFPRFPIFNLADVVLVVSGILFCLYVIFHKDYIPEKDEISYQSQRGTQATQGNQDARRPPQKQPRIIQGQTLDNGNYFNDMPHESPSPIERFISPNSQEYPQAGTAPQRGSNSTRAGFTANDKYTTAGPGRQPAQNITPISNQKQENSTSQNTQNTQNAAKPPQRQGGYSATQGGRSQSPPPPVVPPVRQAQPAPPKQAPRKPFNVNDEIPAFSLDDIIAEFSDNN